MLEVREELNKFARYVIQQSRSNLTKGKKNASKELYNSLGYISQDNKDMSSVTFTMADYGKFQDQGVKGTKSNYIENAKSPFSYKSKMPPPKAFDKWIVRKGIAPRTKSGKFLKRQSLQYLIAKSVFEKGIKASMFFTKPFEAAFKRLPDDILNAYSIGIINKLKVQFENQK